ncbi:MAG: hypothetical protein EXR08_01675 [Alphaproteobacteria bacterium]|nr:hypothetical protein [Alphaproteobacteria bacterium]
MISFLARNGRPLALLILILAMVLVWFGAARPYLTALADSENTLAAAADQLQLFRRASEQTGEDGAGDRTLLQTLLLPGASSSAAAATLQQRIGVLIAESGATQLSFELLPEGATAEAPLQIVTGRVRFTANTQALRTLLHAVESQRPLLLIDNLYVRARSDEDIVAGGHLDVQMDVAAARRALP